MSKNTVLKNPKLPRNEELISLWDCYFDEMTWTGPLFLYGATCLLDEAEIDDLLQQASN
ncbi:MAG: hypothetical protein IV090_00305 [Candidatus Sericytochromatia bacterium]|nr:hypothetical protein [Candidatus Sericytochromatia bacterium]